MYYKHQRYGEICKNIKIAKNLLKGSPTSMDVLYNDRKFNLDINNFFFKSDHKHKRYDEKCEKYKNSLKLAKKQSDRHGCVNMNHAP